MICRSRSLLVGFLLLIGIAGLSVVATGNVAAQQVDVAASDLDGAGTQEDPYVITNASELQAMEDDLDAHYELAGDINASDTAKWNNGKGFKPIGIDFDGFTGSFDGNGNEITHLTIDRPSNSGYFGLFGINSGSIGNISLTNVTVTGKRHVGSLVGINLESGTIQNATVSGSVNGTDSGASIVGGLAGQNRGSIQNVSASGSATGTRIVGGLIGEVTSESPVRNASAQVNITANKDHVGGLVGSNLGGPIKDTFALGSVVGGSEVGGLVGDNSGTVTDSYFDTQATSQSTSDGSATGLETTQMTGQAAETNMTGLDFDSVWKTQPNDYPELATFSDGADASSDADTYVSSSDTTTVAGTNTALDFELNYTGSEEKAHVLDLTLPNGWTVENQSTAEAEWKASEEQWLWQTLTPNQTVTPSVTVTIPANASGTHSIEGTVYTTKDGTQQAVANTAATVTVENRSVILSPADLSLPNGTTSQLVVNATQDDGTLETVTNSADYTVGDPSVATVNTTGSVTAKQTGTTTLTASYAGASNTTTLTVTDAVPESLTTTVGNQTLANGSETVLTATAQLTNGTTAEVTTATSYSSNDSSVITVDEQNATLAAESTGTTSVVAVYEVNETSVRDTVSLTVDPATLEEAIDTNNDRQIGDIEILTAIDYWQTDATVPYTEGERIDALEILDLIYKWRYNITID